MASTFSGLSIATSGLAAARRAVDVAGHNIANANTDGYSRQRVQLTAINGGGIGIHSGAAYQGNGVAVASHERVVDQFLVNRTNTERATLGLYGERAQTYARIEAAFGEPSDQGLGAQIGELWAAWDTVSLAPDDEASRAALLQRADAVASRFRSLSGELDDMSADAIQRADTLVSEVNSKAAQIADLNVAILAAVEAGAPPNDLLDQRDLLVRDLSEIVGVSTRTDDNGQMSVTLGGAALVTGERAAALSLDVATPGAAALHISTSSVPLRLSGGRIDGLLQSVNTVIPGQRQALDEVAINLRDVVNAQHALGQDLDGNPAGGFFAGTGAGDLTLDPAVAGQPRAVAAATAGAGAFDGSNAVAMAELANLDTGPDAAYRRLIAATGVDAQTSSSRLTLQTELTAQVDAQRDEVSGVSLDEEMANLVALQQAYEASARFLTTVDEMLNQLINGTGVVGR